MKKTILTATFNLSELDKKNILIENPPLLKFQKYFYELIPPYPLYPLVFNDLIELRLQKI